MKATFLKLQVYKSVFVSTKPSENFVFVHFNQILDKEQNKPNWTKLPFCGILVRHVILVLSHPKQLEMVNNSFVCLIQFQNRLNWFFWLVFEGFCFVTGPKKAQNSQKSIFCEKVSFRVESFWIDCTCVLCIIEENSKNCNNITLSNTRRVLVEYQVNTRVIFE